jgi:hypothetical protein
MKIKLAVLVVIAAMVISIEQTALAQYMPHPKPTVDSVIRMKFHHIVGRNPTPQELTFWKNLARTNESKGSDANVDTQMMDWFFAPAQASERSAMIKKAYDDLFVRAPTKDEQAKCEVLVSAKRITYDGMAAAIHSDLAVTKITDVAGDPRAINVTVANLGSVSTSVAARMALVIFKGAKCASTTESSGIFVLPSVPPIAPLKSVIVKVASTEILQQANPTRHAYSIYIDQYPNYEPDDQAVNNHQCRAGIAFSNAKVVDEKPSMVFPRNPLAPHGAAATPTKP